MSTQYKIIAGKAIQPLALWLFICVGLVFLMAVIGAITRLTQSGLSMVEWRPYIGVLPPLSEAEWQRVFHLYQQTPEFHLKNFMMDLSQFKKIFFWEWLHRLWGQVISIVFVIPFIWFWLRRRIPIRVMPWLLSLLMLGIFQGLMGWYMVQSGLVDRPDVSHYRLAAHLFLTFLLFSGLLWTGLNVNKDVLSKRHNQKFTLHLLAIAVCLTLTIIWGAFVAGLDAGFIYNTFPFMNGHMLPLEMWHLDPWWINLWENEATVQFLHRWLAVITTFIILSFCWRLWRSRLPHTIRKWVWIFGGITIIQVALGISTLLWVVPIPLAVAHQGGAFILVGTFVGIVHRLRFPDSSNPIFPV